MKILELCYYIAFCISFSLWFVWPDAKKHYLRTMKKLFGRRLTDRARYKDTIARIDRALGN